MKKGLFLLPLLALTLAGCGMTRNTEEAQMKNTEEAQKFYNPIDATEMLGDPWIVQHDGYYYYTCSDGSTLSITKSEKMTTIMTQKAGATTVFTGLEYGLTEIWAPEIFFYDGFWYCYFAADTDHNNTLHRMHVLKSKTEDALGEWDYVGKLELPEDQWAIDGTLFIHPDGRLYHIWSGWLNEEEGTGQWKQYLYITQLEDGNPAAVKSGERVMISEPKYLWELGDLPQNEGPAILTSPEGTVYLVYSANFSGKNNYALGYLKLVGDDPMDQKSWEKCPEPILQTDPELLIYSPGHCSFTKSPDGSEDWVLYHAAKAYDSGWDRSARLQKVEWVEDKPVIPLTSLSTPLTLPAGERVSYEIYEAEEGNCTGSAAPVQLEAASGGAVAAGESGTVEIRLTAEQAERVLFVLRYTNILEKNASISVKVNDKDQLYVFAGRTGGSEIVGSAAFSAQLQEGENTILFQIEEGIALDALLQYTE